ncbi:protein phosphatase 1 regulatory subunit 35 [Engraulis encrasicolus]|uniref:protein phosphatase 1 regulatory subunit 35 n=1 Tax=Engraulis encrasicolus TaxID=184585 RepID=UPI002FD3D276
MTMLQCPFAGFSDPDSQPALPPGPSAAGYGTPLKKCPELDLSITSTPERLVPVDSGILRKNRGVKPPSRQVHFEEQGSKGKDVSPQRACPVERITVLTVTALEKPTSSDRRGKKKKSSSGKGKSDPDADPAAGPAPAALPALSLAEPGDGQLLESAQLHSTLALQAELERVKLEEFNPRRAMEEKLQTSTHTRNQINAKAAEGVNFPQGQQLYHGLVSVSLSHEQLISHALRHRPPLAPPIRSHSNKPPQAPSEAPDLLAFYSPGELLREAPLLPGNQVPLPRPRTKPRPAHATFDLYQRQRQWEA